MPKTKVQKSQELTEYRKMLTDAPVAVLTDFEKLTMPEIETIRKESKKEGVSFKVIKNSLLSVLAKELGVSWDLRKIGKMFALWTGGKDVVAVPKLAAKFVKSTKKMNIYAGIYEGQAVDGSVINQLAVIPSREELLGKMLRSFQSPVSGFVQVLNGNLRKFAYVIQAIKDKQSA